ncbi:MAG: NAD-dependent epimerase/dehydratase family protein [Bdellovibrionia bacterium]
MSEIVLVTGAAGFIGSHLTDRLLKSGRKVVGVDNLSLGKRAFLADALKNPNFHFIPQDMNKLEVVRDELIRYLGRGSEISTIWHLAANSDIPRGVADAQVDLQNTFMTTYYALQLAKTMSVKKFLFASSSAIYGERRDRLTEDSGPLFPISNYGAMKLASEGLITAALESYLGKAWIFRFPNVVGSRASHGAIYDFFRKLDKTPAELEVLGDGSQEKPYIHVGELIDGMTFLHEAAQDKLNYFNIGQDDSRTTVKFMAETVVKTIAPNALIRYTGGNKGWVGDIPYFDFSIEKIKSRGWKPKLNSDQSVELAVQELARGK